MTKAHKLNPAFQRAIRTERKLPEPEPAYAKPRPVVGFFAGLTPTQKAKALKYRGEEHHGEPEFAM